MTRRSRGTRPGRARHRAAQGLEEVQDRATSVGAGALPAARGGRAESAGAAPGEAGVVRGRRVLGRGPRAVRLYAPRARRRTRPLEISGGQWVAPKDQGAARLVPAGV